MDTNSLKAVGGGVGSRAASCRLQPFSDEPLCTAVRFAQDRGWDLEVFCGFPIRERCEKSFGNEGLQPSQDPRIRPCSWGLQQADVSSRRKCFVNHRDRIFRHPDFSRSGEFRREPLWTRVLVREDFEVWQVFFDFLNEPNGRAAGVGELPFSDVANRCEFPQQGFTIPAVGGGWSADEDKAASSGDIPGWGYAVESTLGDDDVLLAWSVFEIVCWNDAEVEPRQR